MDNQLLAITLVLLLLLWYLCACNTESFTYKRSNPAKSRYGDLEVECDQYPMFSHGVSPNKLRVPCGATSTRKLINSTKDDTYGQEGLSGSKAEWDSSMARNVFARYNDTTCAYDKEMMAAKGPTAQRRNQIESIHNKHYN